MAGGSFHTSAMDGSVEIYLTSSDSKFVLQSNVLTLHST
jgi:hypothetical protein